ncbi:MAG TPA: hypothetical protein VGI39_31485 [Polyangiaceae bacterium]|jgi:hypothetical protein
MIVREEPKAPLTVARIERARAAVILAGLALVACKRTPPAAPERDAGGERGSEAGAVTIVDAGAAAARCALDGAGATLADLTDRRSILLGDATPAGGDVLVGAVRTAGGEARASLVRVSGDVARADELLVAHGGVAVVSDAPPPKPLAHGDAVYAAYVTRAGRDAGGATQRLVALDRLAPGAPTRIASFAEHADESLAFDAAVAEDGARVALAWDEDTGAKSVIRVAIVPLSGGGVDAAAAVRTVSGDASDADSPRVVPRAGGGWWLAWTARRPEGGGELDASRASAPGAKSGAELESPGEVRTYVWVEALALDADGVPVGTPRRVTSQTGHVVSIDPWPRATKDALPLLALDETEERADVGGRVLRVTAGTGGSEAVTVASGAGRGAIDLLGGPLGSPGDEWLTFAGRGDHPALVPLAATGGAAGLPSTEDAIEGGRLVAAIRSAEGPGTSGFLVAFPGGDGALFRHATCKR